MSTTNSKSWFEEGYSGVDRETEKRDLGGQPKRWWMRPGDTKQIVFLDDNPVCFEEHQWKVADSKFPNFATCLNKISQEPCPACAPKSGVQKADYTGHLTAVDIDGYKTKDKEVKFELVEFGPKLRAMQKLKNKKNTKGSLIGQLYTVTRTDENSASTGDDFEHIRAANLEALYPVVTYRGKNLSEMIEKANKGDEKMRKFLAHHFQLPESGAILEQIPVFNYNSLHAPMDPADFRKAITGAVSYTGSKFGAGGGGATGSGAASSEDVPF